MSKLDFSALLCSRLCHDLVSPVGAINNGLELLAGEQDETMRDAVFDLIEKSTEQTSNKLQFFRLAFGAAGGFSAHMDTREAEKALRAFLTGGKIDLIWNVSAPELTKGGVKLLLNLGLVAAEALIRGGTMTVQFDSEGENACVFSVSAEGERVIFQEDIQTVLEGKAKESELEPRLAPAYLASMMATELGGAIKVDHSSLQKLSMSGGIKSNS